MFESKMILFVGQSMGNEYDFEQAVKLVVS